MTSPQITRFTMMEPMLAACPSFAPKWEAFLADWLMSLEEPPLYLALGDLARHLAVKIEKRETAEFEKVFDVVERWIVEGDAFVKEAAIVGLLEDLQNTNLWPTAETEDPSRFELWLKPESLRFWFKIHEFWDNGRIITDD